MEKKGIIETNNKISKKAQIIVKKNNVKKNFLNGLKKYSILKIL
jgi:hypothetical protein